MPIVLFSTRNGMSTLPRMLARLSRIGRPAGLRIVAVDDGSTDGSGALLREWSSRLPMEVLDGPATGRHRALDRALDHLGPVLADAELVVFTTDDVVPHEDWLERLLAAARSEPGADLFGGAIEPRWLQVPEGGLLRMADGFPMLFGATRAGSGPCAGSTIHAPNMAVRGRVLAAGARFDAARAASRPVTGHESALLLMLERAGHVAHFCADAVVGRQVQAERTGVASALARARRRGFALALRDARARDRSWMSQAAAALRRCARREATALAARLPFAASRRPDARFEREVARAYLLALVRGTGRRSTARTPGPRDAVAAPSRPVPAPRTAARAPGGAAAAAMRAAGGGLRGRMG